jgi:hypothetical protein
MVRYIAVLLALGLLLAGCRQTQFVPAPEPLLPDADAVYGAGEDRLEPTQNSAEAVLSGQLAISGLTVVDDAGTPVEPAKALSRVLARLVDPEDDILSQVNPDNGGLFKIKITKSLLSGKLVLSVRVAEDLNGDSQGNDLLEQVIPVSLSPGREATLDLTLAPATADVLGDALPQQGLALLARLDQVDASGATALVYATLFASGTVIADRDHDGKLEPGGDDISAPDANSNGWPDSSEQSYAEPAPAGPEVPFESLQGRVESVSLETQSMVLRLDSGTQRTVHVDPFVSIEPYVAVGPPPSEGEGNGGAGGTDEPSYDFLGSLPFDSSLVGHSVIVNGFSSGVDFYAQWIVVLDIV